MVAPVLQDRDFALYRGDARDVLRELPSESVHACLTSPPFFNLRDYGTGVWVGGDPDCDHARDTSASSQNSGLEGGKRTQEEAGSFYRARCGRCGAVRDDRQLGLEDTPQEYVANLLQVFSEVARVLRPEGSLWVEVGDTYRDKQLTGIPFLLAFALQRAGWFWRNVVIWDKPNAMPESARDRLTVAHSYVLLFAKQRAYYFDPDAIRESAQWRRWGTQDAGKYADQPSKARYVQALSRDEILRRFGGVGKHPRSVWTIATEPLGVEHFAPFPQRLAERVIAAATSEFGCCATCGAPWRRVVEREHETGGDASRRAAEQRVEAAGGILNGGTEHSSLGAGAWSYRTLRWDPDCDCGAGVVPCTVLDPFIGSGTTALVARRLGRGCVGIDLSDHYCGLSADRTQQLALEVNE